MHILGGQGNVRRGHNETFAHIRCGGSQIRVRLRRPARQGHRRVRRLDRAIVVGDGPLALRTGPVWFEVQAGNDARWTIRVEPL